MPSFSIPPAHPALAGHFPGNPIVPGVVILDMVIRAAQLHCGQRISGIRKSKFVQVLKADENVEIEWGEVKDHRLRFTCRKTADGSLVSEGNLLLATIA